MLKTEYLTHGDKSLTERRLEKYMLRWLFVGGKEVRVFSLRLLFVCIFNFFLLLFVFSNLSGVST